MELRQLIHFQVVARHESLTRAAEDLYLSQPALSRSISRLEDELGVSLFDRTNNAIRLNQCGEAFLESVRAATAELRNGKNNARQLAGLSGSHVTVVASYLPPLDKLFTAFLATHPQTDLFCDILPEDFICIKLRRFSADFGFTLHPIADDSVLVCQPLVRDHMGLFLPPNHPWQSRTTIGAEELNGQPLFVQTAGAEERERFELQCRQHHLTPRIRMTSPQSTLLLQLSVQEQIPALLSSFSAEQAGVKLLPIEENPFCRTVYVTHHREKSHSLAAQSLQALMGKFFSLKV